jgi:hypothetical protein
LFDFVAFVSLVVDEIGAGGLALVGVKIAGGMGIAIGGIHFCGFILV